MNTNLYATRWATIFFLVLMLAGCGGSPPPTKIGDAQKAVDVPDKNNYEERRQIALAEAIKDRPDTTYFVQYFSQNGDPTYQIVCMSVPNSSTESLEPNSGVLSGAGYDYVRTNGDTGGGYLVPVPVEGARIFTAEQMGRDGTFGDPVPFRFCVTPEGSYEDWPAIGKDYHVSSLPRIYTRNSSEIDTERLAKKLVAEQAVRNGQCIDSRLNVIPCDNVRRNMGNEAAGVIGVGSASPTTQPLATPTPR